MKTIILKNGSKKLMLNGNGPLAIAIIQILSGRAKSTGLMVTEIVGYLLAEGILTKARDEKAAVSSLLQRLMKKGIVAHPISNAASRRYVIKKSPTIYL